MLTVTWRCRKCNKANGTYVDTAGLDPVELGDDPDCGVFHEAECSGCGEKHWLLVEFRVEAEVRQVKTAEEYQTMLAEEEEEAEQARRQEYTRPVRVSRDGGRTWEDMDICTLDTDPATSPLKEGDLIQRRDLAPDDPYARVYRIRLRDDGYLTAEPATEATGARAEV